MCPTFSCSREKTKYKITLACGYYISSVQYVYTPCKSIMVVSYEVACKG